MITSWITIIDHLQQFCDIHPLKPRFMAEFSEQMPNFATESEKYPILFLSPSSITLGENVDIYTVNVWCWDIIQKDRENINYILSDTALVLNDLKKYLMEGDDTRFDILIDAILTPYNNGLLDYTAGWQMTIDIEVDTYCLPEIGLDDD